MPDALSPHDASRREAALRRLNRGRAARFLAEWLKILLASVGLFLVIRTFLVEAFKIPTGSMEHTLLIGDFLLVNKLAYGAELPLVHSRVPSLGHPKLGDVVVFKWPIDTTKFLVKRVVGLPGDTVAMRGGELLRNGQPLVESYAQHIDPGDDPVTEDFQWQRAYLARPITSSDPYYPSRDTWGPLVVPPRRFFVLGDNRDDSSDSRYWGFVSDSAMKGKPMVVYFSYEPDSTRPMAWITRIRWRRLGEIISNAHGKPDAFQIHHDSLQLGTGKFVEYYWTAPAGNGPWPAIVFLHGHQDGTGTPGGKVFADWGVLDSASSRGYVGISVSQPGYGRSSGPPDFMGPATVDAIERVIRLFRAKTFVRADRIGLEGVSRGAVVASLVAANDTTIRAMVLISGAYDFATPLDSSTRGGRRNIARRNVIKSDLASETDGSIAALEIRSALSHVRTIRTPALLFNGELDDRTDPDQARRFAEGIRQNGVFARAIVYPQFGHAIPVAAREREIQPFLDAYLKAR